MFARKLFAASLSGEHLSMSDNLGAYLARGFTWREWEVEECEWEVEEGELFGADAGDWVVAVALG